MGQHGDSELRSAVAQWYHGGKFSGLFLNSGFLNTLKPEIICFFVGILPV